MLNFFAWKSNKNKYQQKVKCKISSEYQWTIKNDKLIVLWLWFLLKLKPRAGIS